MSRFRILPHSDCVRHPSSDSATDQMREICGRGGNTNGTRIGLVRLTWCGQPGAANLVRPTRSGRSSRHGKREGDGKEGVGLRFGDHLPLTLDFRRLQCRGTLHEFFVIEMEGTR